ncbi:KRAB-A domain-containing protein 2-like isoform X2 [Eupeodes corollae]|nr:KRAB-A domain-containing protein 2-like isoform X2 [Eupeodes corollae]
MCAYLTIKAEFENQLNQLLAVKKERTLLMTDDRYNELVLETREAIERRRYGLELSGLHYRRLKRFDIITIDSCDKLIQRNENGQEITRAIHYCKASDMFEAIHSAHLKIGHKKEKGMELELKKMYCNITREVIAIYLKLCQTCALKKKYKETTSSTKVDALPEDLNSRCQIGIIDMEVETHQGFRFVLNYQDHLTKFLILRPLKSNGSEEVAEVLFDIFCLIGVPNVFMCSNEDGFCEMILKKLSENWMVKLIRGEFKQEPIQRISEDIFHTIVSWISHNDSNNWTSCLGIIQSLKNRCFNPSIKRTPFEALFGNRQSSSLLNNHVNNFQLQTEGELRLKIEEFKQKLNEVSEIRKEISKSHNDAMMMMNYQKNCDKIKESIKCLNCDKHLTSEVVCWK